MEITTPTKTGEENMEQKEIEAIENDDKTDPYEELLKNYGYELDMAYGYMVLAHQLKTKDRGYYQILRDIAREEYTHAKHISEILEDDGRHTEELNSEELRGKKAKACDALMDL